MKNGPFTEGTSLPIFPRRISCHQKIACLKGVANFSTPIKGGTGSTADETNGSSPETAGLIFSNALRWSIFEFYNKYAASNVSQLRKILYPLSFSG